MIWICIAAARVDLDVCKAFTCVLELCFEFSQRSQKILTDVIVECLEWADVEPRVLPVSRSPVMKRFKVQRNAVSVLPLPVGAVISRFSRSAIFGQDCC